MPLAMVVPFGYCAPPHEASIMDWFGRTYFQSVVTSRLALTRMCVRGEVFVAPLTSGQTCQRQQPGCRGRRARRGGEVGEALAWRSQQ